MARYICALLGALAATLLAAGAPAFAKVVAGVSIPPAIQTDRGVLEPASCGVRRTMWIDHYVSALYLPREAGPRTLLDARQPKAVIMKIVDARYLPEQIPDKWWRALRNELHPHVMQRLHEAYRGLKQGDTVTIEYLPLEGMLMRVNGKTVVRAAGHRAIESILVAWAEDEPLESKLEKLPARHPC